MNKAPWIVANMIIGGRPEPFFSSCLASVEKGIDFLVLNDNSGDLENPNLKAFYASKLFKERRTALIQTKLSELSGFDEARNLCLRETGKRFADENVWILNLDADEVHASRLPELTRKFLPSLPASVGVVDGYFYQFIQSFDFYVSMDRRHNLLVKYNQGIRWEKPIHEKLMGLKGKRIPTGYLFFHYGYVYSPLNILRRWQLYKEYGAFPVELGNINAGDFFKVHKKQLVPFRGCHPKALSLYFEENHNQDHVSQFNHLAHSFFSKYPWHHGIAKVKELNWQFRLAFRDFQAKLGALK